MNFDEQLNPNIQNPEPNKYDDFKSYMTDYIKNLAKVWTDLITLVNFRTSNKYTAMAYLNTAQDNLTDTVQTKVKLDKTEYDAGGYFDTTNNKYVVKISGRYLIVAQVSYKNLVASGTSNYSCFIVKNSTIVYTNVIFTENLTSCYVPAIKILDLIAGDTIELDAKVTVGANTVDLNSGLDKTFLNIKLIG
jgi:hypothetical protein